MISDAFCNSMNCHREFLHMVRSRKYIVPLLVPDHGLVNTNVGGQQSSGWTGAFSAGDQVCMPKEPYKRAVFHVKET